MPYIKANERVRLDCHLVDPAKPGELNYVLTRACLDYVVNTYGIPSYTAYNEIIGALECCKLEMYRRSIAPYEDKKILENGDVY